MQLIDFILNLACLWLWLRWLAIGFETLPRSSAASLAGTLRKAEALGPKRWNFLASLLSILMLRAMVYLLLTGPFDWIPRLNLGIINLRFHSNALVRGGKIAELFQFSPANFERMLLFSGASFAWLLLAFYSWLLLLSLANFKVPDAEPLQKLVRLHLGRVERWPGFIKVLLPFAAGAGFWLVLNPLVLRLTITPPSASSGQLLAQAGVVGISAYLNCKYLLIGILLVHVVNSHVFLGSQPVWAYLNATARNLLAPLRWIPLRAGKVDLLPVLEIVLIVAVTEAVTHPPGKLFGFPFREWFYQNLPF